MALEFEKLEKKAAARGHVVINGFTGAVKDLDLVTLELNDEFTLPMDYKVRKGEFGEYFFIKTDNTNKELEFYPSIFTRSRQVFNEDLTPTGVRKHTMGSAAEQFRNHATVAEAMADLAGHTIKVSAIETIRSKRYDRNELQDVRIMTLDVIK